jgi:hypothetical protein
MVKKITEGWVVPFAGSRKWHYFREEGRSLCGNYALLVKTPEANPEQGKDDSPDNCSACRKKLKKLQEKGKVT